MSDDFDPDEYGWFKLCYFIPMALATHKFTAGEYRVLMFVLRETYGRGPRKNPNSKAPVSAGFIAANTGMSRQHAIRVLKGLIDKRVLKVFKEASGRRPGTIGIEKIVDLWEVQKVAEIWEKMPTACDSHEESKTENFVTHEEESQKKVFDSHGESQENEFVTHALGHKPGSVVTHPGPFVTTSGARSDSHDESPCKRRKEIREKTDQQNQPTKPIGKTKSFSGSNREIPESFSHLPESGSNWRENLKAMIGLLEESKIPEAQNSVRNLKSYLCPGDTSELLARASLSRLQGDPALQWLVGQVGLLVDFVFGEGEKDQAGEVGR